MDGQKLHNRSPLLRLYSSRNSQNSRISDLKFRIADLGGCATLAKGMLFQGRETLQELAVFVFLNGEGRSLCRPIFPVLVNEHLIRRTARRPSLPLNQTISHRAT